MLRFIIGAARSGKSQYAEQAVASLSGPTVYIGTLPADADFAPRISRHRSRRPSSWSLLELTGNPDLDLKSISDALDHNQNLLLDGLAFYTLQFVTIFDFEPSEFNLRLTALADRFAKHRGEVVVVDQPVPALCSQDVKSALQHLHVSLIRRSEICTWVTEGVAASLSAREVIELDRLGR